MTLHTKMTIPDSQVPLKALSDQKCGRYCRFSTLKMFNSRMKIPICFTTGEMLKSVIKICIH